MDPFWMVMSSDPDRPAPRYRHSSLEVAMSEAKRLALKQPGEKFFVLASVGVASTPPPVSYEIIEADSIPF